MKYKTLVLCSGGPDGIVAAAFLKREGFQVTLLHFMYGQKASLAERSAVQSCAVLMGLKLMEINLADVFDNIKSSLLLAEDDKKAAQLKGKTAFCPARNLIFHSVAAGIAESLDFAYVANGNIADGIYPDNKPVFTLLLDQMMPHSLSAGVHVRCLSPVNDRTKAEVLKLGFELQVPLHLTWSCYTADEMHCGECASCIARKNAFLKADLPDPTAYKF